MKHMRLRRGLAALLSVCLLLPGCANEQRAGPPAQTLPDAPERIRLGEALLATLQQRAGGIHAPDPVLGGYVAGIGETLARLGEQPWLPWEFVVLNRSAPSLWALPGGKIALSRGLLVRLDDEAELAALLALAIDHALSPADVGSGRPHADGPAPLTAIGTVRDDAAWDQITLRTGATGTPTPPAGTAEASAADQSTLARLARAGYDPQALPRLLQRLAGVNTEADWSAGPFAAQPPSSARAEAAARAAQKLGAGERGEARFRERTARLTRDRPAYAIYERGIAAFDAGQNAEALAAAREALALQPREALFHELHAVAAAQLGRPADAFTGLNRAIALNPGFHRPYLLRGLQHLARGNLEPAGDDLQTANRLLPSEEATLGLAEVARGLGDTAGAGQRYAAVASGNSVAAAFARERAAQLAGATRADRTRSEPPR